MARVNSVKNARVFAKQYLRLGTREGYAYQIGTSVCVLDIKP